MPQKQKRHHERTSYETPEDFLMHFFIQTTLLVMEAPDSLLDVLEKGLHLSQERREEMRRRLQELEQKEEG